MLLPDSADLGNFKSRGPPDGLNADMGLLQALKTHFWCVVNGVHPTAFIYVCCTETASTVIFLGSKFSGKSSHGVLDQLLGHFTNKAPGPVDAMDPNPGLHPP